MRFGRLFPGVPFYVRRELKVLDGAFSDGLALISGVLEAPASLAVETQQIRVGKHLWHLREVHEMGDEYD